MIVFRYVSSDSVLVGGLAAGARLTLDGPYPPVLKHGPRSLTRARVVGCQNLMA